ncbi:MAG TPA: hypothetical protein VE709_16860, partial [Pseudonocardiaceae bacterium]|nr:hypothetical protein [Pseudonocardiaceae bacterium]
MNESDVIFRLCQIREIISRDGRGDPRSLEAGHALVAESAQLRRQLVALRATGRAALTRSSSRTQPRLTPPAPARSAELDGDLGDPRWCAAQVARMRSTVRPWDLSAVRGADPVALRAELRSRALRAVERMAPADDPVREAATRLVEDHSGQDSELYAG